MSPRPRILVTGATGFIGTALTRALLAQGFPVRITGQAPSPELEALGAQWFPMADLLGEVDWAPALEGVEAVVHLAGLAHCFNLTGNALTERFERINHQATRSLAEAIKGMPGVTRLLFVSSVAVHGEPARFPLRAGDPLAPTTAYGQSKLDAERALAEILGGQPCRYGIFRPVLVFGPGNPGNMSRLESLVRHRIPVPVGLRPNRRSFLFVGNLVAAMMAYLTLDQPPTGEAWIIADDQACSTRELVQAIGQAKGIKPLLLPLPWPVLAATARLGDLLKGLHLPCPWTSETLGKLLGDYYVDALPVQTDLRWQPPFTLAQGMAQTYPAGASQQD